MLQVNLSRIHPWKLTWNLKSTQLKRKIIFHPPPWPPFWGSMINFPGCNQQKESKPVKPSGFTKTQNTAFRAPSSGARWPWCFVISLDFYMGVKMVCHIQRLTSNENFFGCQVLLQGFHLKQCQTPHHIHQILFTEGTFMRGSGILGITVIHQANTEKRWTLELAR